MLRNEEDSPLEGSPSKIFLGVSFVLLGFDPIEEAKVRPKLVSGGGIDAGECGPSCTHVIVDKIVYDDPACVAARNNGKTVVNALWVDDSFDVGMPVDASSILYRPVKELNGIPGAKSLSICLTGYRRQDRDDIMRMVGFMGAHFSKPLVANKVTHLICYKFEGEKYELAKKMKKIKLVNERWLEDCLKSWEILPESNYNKSGYELEIIEAEAKDSEEETEEDRDTKQFGKKNVSGGPSNLKSGSGTLISEGSEFPIVGEASKIHHNEAEPKNLSDVSKDIITNKGLLASPGKETSPYLHDVNKKGLGEFAFQGTRAYCGDAINGQFPSPYDKSPNIIKQGSELASNLSTDKRSPLSDAANISYSRKTPRRLQDSMFSEAMSSHVHGSLQGHLEEHKIKDGFDISLLKYEQAKNNLDFGGVQIRGNDSNLNLEEGRTDTLPQKRKAVLSSLSPTKRSPSSKAHTSGTMPTSSISEGLIIGAPMTKSSHSVSNSGNALDRTNVGNSGENQSANLSKANSSNIDNKSLKSGLSVLRTTISDSTGFLSDVKMLDIVKEGPAETSLTGFKQSNLVTKPDVGDENEMSRSIDLLDKAGEPQKQQQDGEVSSPNTKNSEMSKSRSPVNLGVPKGRKSEASSSSRTKKTLVKRSLGSRPKVSTGSTGKQKGSLYLNKTLAPNGATLCSANDKDGTKHEKTFRVESEMTRPMFEVDAVIGKKTEGVFCSVNIIEKKTVCMDDDTEAPEEENDGARLENAVGKEIHEQTFEVDVTMEEKLEGMLHAANEAKKDTGCLNNETVASGEDVAGPENAIGGEKAEVGDSAMKDRILKRQETFPSKSKKNPVYVVKKLETSGKNKEGVELKNKTIDEMMELEKAKGVQHSASKSKGKTASVNKAEKPVNVEENQAIENGDLRNGTKHLSSKSKKAPVSVVKKLETSGKDKEGVELENKTNDEKMELEKAKGVQYSASKSKGKTATVNKVEKPVNVEENQAIENGYLRNGTKHLSSKSKKIPVSVMKEIETPRKGKDVVELEKKNNVEQMEVKAKALQCPANKPKCEITTVNKKENPMDAEKENKPTSDRDLNLNLGKRRREEVAVKSNRTPMQINKLADRTDPCRMRPVGGSNFVSCEPVWFILSGHRLQRKEFQQVIRRLKGRLCRDSHHWSYQATHFIVPDPVRRTEKFFAAAASGRWILKTDYLTASNQAGRFLEEDPYEWFHNGLSEDGAINLEAPRKWRLLRERTGHGAFYGMRIIVYGECIAPPLDTLKRAVKAGDGTILATSPPYTRFLDSGVDFAVVSPSMPRVDSWVQEFLRHEIPCIVPDYLVEYVCKPGYSLEKHVLYKTHAWAEKSFANLLSRSKEIIEALTPSENDGSDDIACQVCGSHDRGEVMLICGDEAGSMGCGVGIHIDCCDPPLEAVPEDDWFCPKCSKGRNNTKNPPKRTKKGSSLKK